jgi:CBS domain-containing protein
MTIEPGAHLAAAEYLIKHSHDTALVVTTADAKEAVATITDAEVSRAIADGGDLEDTRVSQVVAPSEMTIDVDLLAEDAAQSMLSQGINRLPVVDGQRFVGVVELADLLGLSLEPAPFTDASGSS